MLKFIWERTKDYNPNYFLNELFEASKAIGGFEARIDNFKFSNILVPMFRIKEVVSSMQIEGTQTTISDVLEDNISTIKNTNDKALIEYRNHAKAIITGAEFLQTNPFSERLIKELHAIMLDGLKSNSKVIVGNYKTRDNHIVNSQGKVVFEPPSYNETSRYMKELISYMNNPIDSINPLVKAAIIHSQFESIHPFEDGNGRVGRLLISLYLYKAKVINFPFFYISEAISQDKMVYYSKLTDSRVNSYDGWIKFFLTKCTVQAEKLCRYIDSINELYDKTKHESNNAINSVRVDELMNCIFENPIVNSSFVAEKLSITQAQANRYLSKLEGAGILQGDDKKRNRQYSFQELLELARK